MTSASLFDTRGVSVQDRAALKVVEYLIFDEAEGCGTHNGGKIGRPGTRSLRVQKIRKLLVYFQRVINCLKFSRSRQSMCQQPH